MSIKLITSIYRYLVIFNCIVPSIVFQEVPNEISLCFSISGCKVGCNGCHSTELWHAKNGMPLTNENFRLWLKKYQGLISCVVFFGGEWQPKALIEKLLIAKKQGLKTCLYSGEESGEKYIDMRISQHLNFLKTGAWHQELGGLESPTTNQVFRNVLTGEKLNHLFNKSRQTQNQSTINTDLLQPNTYKNYQLTQGATNAEA